MSTRVGIATILAGLVVLGACGTPPARTLPAPSSTSSTEPTATTVPPDYSRVALDPVPGETTTTAPMTEGSSTLRGSVQGPDGPVPDAVVRADRLVGDAVQRSEARTGPDGTFTLERIPGGRFRVRAFLPPSLAMDTAEVFYLTDGDERDLRLIVQEFTGLAVRASTTPSSPIVGHGVNLAVRVAERAVDDDGVARQIPQPGVLVRLTYSGWTAIGRGRGTSGTTTTTDDDEDDDDRGDDPGRGSASGDYIVNTDGSGIALFEFRCDRVTSVSATAIVGPDEETFALAPPPCSPVPTTTTTTATTSTTAPDDDGPRSTSTTEG